MKKIILTVVLVCAFLGSTTFAAQQEGQLIVYPINDSPFGQTYTQWVADWARWVYSIPSDRNPFIQGNLNCTQPQYGPVWFIGTATNDPGVSCDVPWGKAIFLHVGAYVDTWPCPDHKFKPKGNQTLEEFLTLDAQNVVDYYTNTAHTMPNALTIDNKLIFSQTDALERRLSSGLFNLTGDLSLQTTLDSCVTGTLQQAVADGYWVIISGLNSGKHKISFTDGTSMTLWVKK